MVVYADVVFIENLIINFVILYVTVLLKKIKVSYFRILFSSICGSIYAIISLAIDNIIFKLMLSIVMIIIICPTKNIKKFLETLGVFYLISITAGGSSIAISYMLSGYQLNAMNGIVFVDFPIFISAVGLVIGILLIMITVSSLKSKISKKDIFYDIEIFIGTRRAKIKALLDTGNMLKDPLTNKPVIVVVKRSVQNILPEEFFDYMKLILGGDKLGKITNRTFANRIKIIPFNSLGNEHGILIGIRSDKIVVDNIEIKDVIIGIYEKEFSKARRYDALIGIDLLDEEECNYELDRKIKK